MFNLLSKEKTVLSLASQKYHLAQQQKDTCLWLATQQSKEILSSPQGLAASFAAGSFKGATSSNAKGYLVRLATILGKSFI